MTLRTAPATALLALLAGCAAPPAGPAATPLQPESASGWAAKPGWALRRMGVAAANPLATEAGWEMLQAGGNALDAAIAVQMALTLVEPQSSGIGGGAFLMFWDGSALQAWDGRETAPAGADESLFLRPDGTPMAYADAVVGGRSVGVPGALRMLEVAHRHGGRLPWARLLQPALRLAEDGFPVSPRLHAMLQADVQAGGALRRDPIAARHFYRADGTPQPVGHLLKNPALAQVLRAVAARGSAALHEGAVAADLVARVRGHANPGRLDAADLAGYTPRRREALCSDWRDHWRVCGFPPPSSGQIAILQLLGMLDRPAPAAGDDEVEALHRYVEASRLAFADRALYVADPDFVPAPGGDWRRLVDPDYLAQRARLIGPRAMEDAPAGRPAGFDTAFAPGAEQPEHGTSHISVVDADGGVVAMTTSIEAAFGARLMADGGSGLDGGYLLNNQLTDFDFRPRGADGRPVANRVQPGKRPRSSMSPTLVFDRRSGEVVATLGSPGGPLIIHFTAKTLIGLFERGLNAQQAIDAPNVGPFGRRVLLERGRFPAATLRGLRERGHAVVETELPSGIQAIERVSGAGGDGWFGGADPRREGIVIGD